LAAPESTVLLRSILVPVDGSPASLQAVALASDIGRKNKGRVYVVHVIEVKRTLALDAALETEEAAGDEVLAGAEEVARRQGFQIEGEILHAREAGPAIVDEAIERAADVIIMGIGYQGPFGEFQLPRVVQAVLKSAPCQVWVCREAVRE
jgi:nucleotide-binding universal stress UspA family protein